MFKNGMRPVHPGEILLEDYIKPMGVSVRAVAVALHVPYSRLSEITKGQRGVSADTALRLERYFGSEAKGWLNLQAAYELRVAEIENGKSIVKQIQPIALVARTDTPVGTERHASFCRNGRNQAVRTPREFEIGGTEVMIRKEGDCLILTPIAKYCLLDLPPQIRANPQWPRVRTRTRIAGRKLVGSVNVNARG